MDVRTSGGYTVVRPQNNPPVRKPKKRLFVEGGGDSKGTQLASECRRAFQKMFEKAGIKEKPSVVVCGAREQAYQQFKAELQNGNSLAWLLVDAEELAPALKPGDSADPWKHVKDRDQWDKPTGATSEQLQLMNVTMETWLLCDRDALRKNFGSRINESKLLPADSSLETKTKQDINNALAAAVKDTPSEEYSKGSHSFKILADVNPTKLRSTLFWADRFLLEMGAPMIEAGSASRQPVPPPLP